jgi:hypothetical protein
MSEHLDSDQMRQLVADRVQVAGGVRAWCRVSGVSPSMVSHYLHGRPYDCPPAISAALGYVRRCVYEYQPNISTEQVSRQRTTTTGGQDDGE